METYQSSAFVWSKEDFETNLERCYESGTISQKAYQYLSAIDDYEKFDFVADSIESMEEMIMEMINNQITYIIELEAEKIQ